MTQCHVTWLHVPMGGVALHGVILNLLVPAVNALPFTPVSELDPYLTPTEPVPASGNCGVVAAIGACR